MTGRDLLCPVCGHPVRQNHTCRARALANPPLEGEEAAAWARAIKDQLRGIAPTGAPTEPLQTRIDFGSEGL